MDGRKTAKLRFSNLGPEGSAPAWWWDLTAANGHVLAGGGPYSTRSAARGGFESARRYLWEGRWTEAGT